MWLATVEGWFSIACAQKTDGSINPDTVMIRARCKKHLQNLLSRFPVLAGTKIVTLPKRDYRYRLIVPKSVWLEILLALAGEQRWSNFKREVERREARVGANYVTALHEVWHIMARIQR